MSVGEAFQLSGAAAGAVSLAWLVLTQIFGTYEARTIRQALVKYHEELYKALDVLERLAASRVRQGQRRQR